MYPNTYYRVSIKAYITNDQGQVFVVKENDKGGNSWWDLPGGGLDHGETPAECLKREIQEELSVDDVTVGDIIDTKTFYLDQIDAWMVWIVYHAKIGSGEHTYADGVTDAKFIDAQELEHSEDMFEKAVFEINQTIKGGK